MNREVLNQAFIDCAFYGYLDGLKAILQAGVKFTHATWVEALKSAAVGDNLVVSRYIMSQFVVQKHEVVMDADWLTSLSKKSPEIAAEVDQADRYVRAIKLREKLAGFGIQAPEVATPSFYLKPAVVYAFVDDGGSAGGSDGLIYAGSDQFSRPKPTRKTESEIIGGWLHQTGGVNE